MHSFERDVLIALVPDFDYHATLVAVPALVDGRPF
jgi:hypothetical protein